MTRPVAVPRDAPSVFAGASPADAPGRPLVVHAELRWDDARQRPRRLFSRLAAHHPVLYVEAPVHEGDAAPSLRVTAPHPRVARVVPVLPQAHPRDADTQCATVAPLLRAALASHPGLAGRFDGAIQWFCSPLTAPAFLGDFGTVGAVHDRTDGPADPHLGPPGLDPRERHLLRHARLVFDGCPQSRDATSRLHPDVHCVGRGIDAAHFARALEEATEVPHELARLPAPVLGYAGEIDGRIDWALLERLCRAFPGGSVAMVGPCRNVDPAALPKAPNLHWLGPRRHEELPALLKGFDVCLMPLAPDRACRGTDAAKTLEYMAAGRPVVSTALPEVMRRFVPVVEVATDHDAFVDAVAGAWRTPCVELLARGLERARRESWEAIAESMRSRLLEAFRPSRPPPADARTGACRRTRAEPGAAADSR